MAAPSRRVVVAVPERSVRDALARFLTERGHTVERESTVAGAVARAVASPELGAIVCASGLSGGGPAALIEGVRAAGSRAGIVVLLDPGAERIEGARVTCLDKPVRLTALAAAIEELRRRAIH